MDITGLRAEPIKKHMTPTGFFKYYRDDVLVAKHCGNCNELRLSSDFYPRTDRPDGLQSKCTPCHTATSKESYRRTFEKDSTIYTKRAETQRTNLRARTDYEIAKDMARLRPNGTKRCRKCKKTLSVIQYYTQRVRSDGLTSHCKTCDTKDARDRYQKPYIAYWIAKGIPLRCYVCSGDWSEIEHVVPTKLGGTDSEDNLLPTCVVCNRGPNGKFNTPLLKWLQTYRPDAIYSTISTVLSYGVSPWTYLDSPEEIDQILTELESVL